MPSTHRVIHSAEITLPKANGDRDFTAEFDAPYLDPDGGAQTRPYLSYRVNPSDEARVHLLISVNGTTIVDQTLERDIGRSFNQVFAHELLRSDGNDLRVFVPSDEPGELIVSDLLVVYTSPVPPTHTHTDTESDPNAGVPF